MLLAGCPADRARSCNPIQSRKCPPRASSPRVQTRRPLFQPTAPAVALRLQTTGSSGLVAASSPAMDSTVVTCFVLQKFYAVAQSYAVAPEVLRCCVRLLRFELHLIA